MAKYSFEFKKRIIHAYNCGEGGQEYLAKKYGVASSTNIRKWINAYEKFGNEGLMRSGKNEVYTFEFKIYVVELYLTTKICYQDLALSVGMNNPPLISKWVNDYRIAGPDALKPKRKGRQRKVNKSKVTTECTASKSNDNQEYMKKLEEENLKLRIENAYLKELRRLRLEDEARLREQQESSTVSEENSD